MVQQVEEFRAELYLLGLSNFEILLQHKIEIDQIRATQVPDARVPVAVCRLLPGSERRRNERSLVIPAVQSLVAGIGATEVRPLRARC